MIDFGLKTSKTGKSLKVIFFNWFEISKVLQSNLAFFYPCEEVVLINFFFSLFNNEEIQRIKQLNLYDIIWAVTKISYNDIPLNPFAIPNNGRIFNLW